MKVRKANKKDFEGYFKLVKEFRKSNNSLTKISDLRYKLNKPKNKKDFLKKVNKRNKSFLVLESNKGLQGYLYGVIEKMNQGGYKFPIDNIGYLSHVFINKKYRGQGYFSKMLKEFFKYLKSKKIKYCTLHSLINNKRALAVYIKQGFKVNQCGMVSKIK